jgi:hypothetical protein
VPAGRRGGHPAQECARAGHLLGPHQVEAAEDLEAGVAQHLRELWNREPVHCGKVRVIHEIPAVLAAAR